MEHTSEPRPRVRRTITGKALVILAAATIVGVTACGSSSATKASGTTAASGSATTAAAGATTEASSDAGSGDKALTVSVASVPGVGSVLVNQDGDTLYLLSSEKGGKITCTDDNGCTKAWPDTELPDGVTSGKAGAGADASLLGTAKGGDGDLYVTYGGYPLYTFAGDGGTAGKANGEGITSFGGTWYAVSATGMPVMPTASGATTTTSGY